MSKCGKCSGDCCSSGKKEHDCGSTPAHSKKINYFARPKKKDVYKDATSLDVQCTCQSAPKVKRHGCIACLTSWVNAMSIEEVEKELQYRKQLHQTIVVERLEELLKARIRAERFIP